MVFFVSKISFCLSDQNVLETLKNQLNQELEAKNPLNNQTIIEQGSKKYTLFISAMAICEILVEGEQQVIKQSGEDVRRKNCFASSCITKKFVDFFSFFKFFVFNSSSAAASSASSSLAQDYSLRPLIDPILNYIFPSPAQQQQIIEDNIQQENNPIN